MPILRRCWAEIDLAAVEHNLTEYRKLLTGGTELMCVVKAACYGHDDRLIVPFLQEKMGVRWFAVSNLDEAERLREMGVTSEILILGYTPPECAKRLAAGDIIQACTELSYAEELSRSGEGVRLHAAIDTGMTRIGLHGSTEEICAELRAIASLDCVRLEGIFTHYSSADGVTEADEEYTKMQTERFFKVKDMAERQGLKLEQAHIMNSAGGAYRTTDRSTLARLGIILYGLYPDPKKPLPFKPEPVMTLKAVISQVKEIPAGTAVSYGRTYVSERAVRLATVTAGYADGYPRALSNKGEVKVHGVRCPIAGRVCMDQFMCDVSAVPDALVGDEVILMDKELDADEIAGLTGTIGYEITCGISSRVPRIEAGSLEQG